MIHAVAATVAADLEYSHITSWPSPSPRATLLSVWPLIHTLALPPMLSQELLPLIMYRTSTAGQHRDPTLNNLNLYSSIEFPSITQLWPFF